MSIRKQVKSGKNRGKLFYSCSKFGTSMHDERCDFFSWEEPRIVNTPLKFSRQGRTCNEFFYRNEEVNVTPTKPSHASPVKTISQLYNSSKYNRNNKPKYTCELNTSTIFVDKKTDRIPREVLQDSVDNNQDIRSYLKKLEMELDYTKRELNRTKVECNNLEISNVGLKRKLQDEKERNESLVKSNKRIRKDLNDKNKKILRMMQRDAYK
ncbi:776_t:CDS:1 [Funneliformis caledonium]|uniref:776_t:CDS:1 n=1 Tax=Funneliformis caledonium TaxID=1117310 RepID=A0A9N8VJQ8_9GLOM|nr:776_t:CDS:1 [Funneliformis caledonium]